MDAITQIQNYIRTIADVMVLSVADIASAPAVSVDSNDMPNGTKLEERAKKLFQLAREVDILIASLPEKYATEAEQLEEIRLLEHMSEAAGIRLKEARDAAVTSQQQLSSSLQTLAKEQFRTLGTSSSSREDEPA